MDKGTAELNVVTGAFGYTGKYITQRLLSMGKRVRTLTGHPNRPNPFGYEVEIAPLNFDDPDALTRSLRGAATLYNTYWVRFTYGQVTFEKAIANTKALILAAEKAGLRKIVHISVANASEDSTLPYFRGKGILEKAIRQSRLSYAIIRPTVIFGVGDILINNIAWVLRRFPAIAVPGRGDYRLQPVFVEDVAEMAVSSADEGNNVIIDAIGPEVYTFDELIELIARALHRKARIIHVKPALALFLSRWVSYAVCDVLLTDEEVEGLMANLLVSENPPTGQTRFRHWLEQNAHILGINYASELARHYR